MALDGLEVSRPSLEDVYLSLTGAGSDETPATGTRATETRGAAREHGEADRLQIRYVNKAFWRNPASAFFTFAFPLMFLVIFTSLLGHYTVQIGTGSVNTSTYYVASMASFAVYRRVLQQHRDQHHLPAGRRRAQAGPWHAAARRRFLGARILHALFIAVILVAHHRRLRPFRL